jgi:hypothetical protein
MTRRYSGDLAKPIKLDRLGPLHTPAQYEAWSKVHVAEVERRMGLLFEEHGVKAGDWMSLCWSLALDLPSFQLASDKSLGRRKHWDDVTRTLLILSIEEHQALERSVTDATKRLAKEEPWRSMVRHAEGAERLRSESTRPTDPSLLPMFRAHRDLMIASGQINDEPGAFARNYLSVNYAQHEPRNEQ